MIQNLLLSNEDFKGVFNVKKQRQDERGLTTEQPGKLYFTNFRVIFDPENKDQPKLLSLEWETKICKLKYNPKVKKVAMYLTDQCIRNGNTESILEFFGFDNTQDMENFQKQQKLCFNNDTHTILGSSIARAHADCMPLAKARRTACVKEEELSKGMPHSSIHESLYIGEKDTPTEEQRKVIFSVYPALEEAYKELEDITSFWKVYHTNFCKIGKGTMDLNFTRFGQPKSCKLKSPGGCGIFCDCEACVTARKALEVHPRFNVFTDAGEYNRSKFTSRIPTKLAFSGNYNNNSDVNEIHDRFEEKRKLSAGWCPLNRQSGLSVQSGSKRNSDSSFVDMEDEELCMLENQKGPSFEPLSLEGSILPPPPPSSSSSSLPEGSGSGSTSPPAFAVKRQAFISSMDPAAYQAMDLYSLFRTMESSINSTSSWAKVMTSTDSSVVAGGGSPASSSGDNLEELTKYLSEIKYHQALLKFWDYVNDEKFKSNPSNTYINKVQEITSKIRQKKTDVEQNLPKMKMACERILEPLLQADKVWKCIKQIYQIN